MKLHEDYIKTLRSRDVSQLQPEEVSALCDMALCALDMEQSIAEIASFFHIKHLDYADLDPELLTKDMLQRLTRTIYAKVTAAQQLVHELEAHAALSNHHLYSRRVLLANLDRAMRTIATLQKKQEPKE